MVISLDFLQTKHLPAIMEWHNDPETCRRIAIEDFKEWFRIASSRLDYFVWVASDNQELIGQITVELIGYRRASIAFIINPTHRRKGYGKKIIRLIVEHVSLAEVDEIEAWVDEDNLGSIKCLESTGFRRNHIDDNVILYNLNK